MGFSIGTPGLIGVGLGLLGHSFHHGYGQAENYMNQGAGYLGDESNIAGQYGGLAQGALGNYGTDNQAYRNAVNNYADYLQQDPYTDQYSTAALNRATAGGAAAYQNANSALTANLASRGFDGPSSMLTGGLASIGSGYAQQQANAQNQLAMQQISQHQANLQGLTGLYNGEAGQDYSRGTGALNSQAGLDNNLYSGYDNLSQQSRAATDSYNNGVDSEFAGFQKSLGLPGYAAASNKQGNGGNGG